MGVFKPQTYNPPPPSHFFGTESKLLKVKCDKDDQMGSLRDPSIALFLSAFTQFNITGPTSYPNHTLHNCIRMIYHRHEGRIPYLHRQTNLRSIKAGKDIITFTDIRRLQYSTHGYTQIQRSFGDFVRSSNG